MFIRKIFSGYQVNEAFKKIGLDTCTVAAVCSIKLSKFLAYLSRYTSVGLRRLELEEESSLDSVKITYMHSYTHDILFKAAHTQRNYKTLSQMSHLNRNNKLIRSDSTSHALDNYRNVPSLLPCDRLVCILPCRMAAPKCYLNFK